MKTLLCWVVMGMVRMMAGQSVAGQMRCLSAAKDELSAKCILEESRTCDDKITFHGSSKLIKDIFPEECLRSKPGHANVPEVYQSGKDIPLESPDNTKMPDEFGHDCGSYPCDPPPDVPAIKKPAKSWIVSESVCNESQMCFDGPITCSNHGTLKIGDTVHDSLASCEGGYVYGCADTMRILLHNEQTPPKYYCHKPETK